MTERKVKIGFIGCGWIVEFAHLPAFSKINNVEITSVFDLDLERAVSIREKYNIHGAYNDIDEFLSSGIDAVVIATPNNTHAQLSLAALKAGLHVLCEKPIAIYSEEVKEVIKAAKCANKVFVPGFVNRFRKDVMKVRQLVESNKIGEVVEIQAGWLRRAGIPRPGTWFTNKAHSGGGVLIDLGSHVIDICSMLLRDAKPVCTKISNEREDNIATNLKANWFTRKTNEGLEIDVEHTSTVEIRYDNRTTLQLKFSWAAEGVDGDSTYFIVKGTKGNVQLRTLFGFSTDRLWKEDSLILQQNGTKTDLTYDMGNNNSRNAFGGLANFFVKAILGERDNYLTVEDALKSVELIESLYAVEKSDSEVEFTSLEG